jgi:hypothetical protein
MVVGTVSVAVLLVLGLVVWQRWPRPVAPALTPQMVADISHSGRSITPIDGGSKRDAHTLWARYHDLRPSGDPPTAPRLLGISLAHVRMQGSPGDGTYWVVYLDHVWSPSFGSAQGPTDAFGRSLVFVSPGSLEAVSEIVY